MDQRTVRSHTQQVRPTYYVMSTSTRKARMMKNSILLALLVSAISISSSLSVSADDRAGLDFFEKNVRPLLVQHCYECHSQKAGKNKGGLLLDRRSGWAKGGDSGPSIVPKKPSESLFVEAINYESLEMPPKSKLKPAEIAIFEKWIQLGVPDPRDGEIVRPGTRKIDFNKERQAWAFQKPLHSLPTAPVDAAWAAPIDRFVFVEMNKRKIKPVALAPRDTWLRRVTFDLTGLPPTSKERADFINDSSDQAKSRVVDRLLASKQFGVHWARHWMDISRYADSNGGDINLTYFNAWRYRDYVVNAFNSDKPYDEFIREQIAGDQLLSDSDHQRAQKIIATGFLIIGPKMLSERNKEKLHMDVVDEQLDTIGRVFMGLTLGCARCHDHKFDPISTKDYYALAGILRSTETVYGIRMGNVNVSGWLEQDLPMSADLVAKISAHAKLLKTTTSELASIKRKLGTASRQTPKPQDLPGIIVDDTQATLVGAWKKSTFSKRFVGVGYIHDEQQDRGKKSVTFTPDIPQAGEYEVRISFPYSKGRASNVPVVVKDADGEHALVVNQERPPEHNLLFKSLGRFRFEKGSNGYVRISNKAANGYVIADAAQFLDVKIQDTEKPAKDKAAQEALRKQKTKLEAQLKQLKANAPKKPQAMAVRDFPKVADTSIRIRGVVDQHGPVAPRGFLQVVGIPDIKSIDASTSGRVELANWISHPDNPLTARVMVNRIWAKLIGEGIVRSVDNFGRLGHQPSNPGLLDRLATDFVRSGWSIKSTIRESCLTRTYGLGSEFNAQAYELDPENKWHWRHARVRLPAESIRDSMLATSGQLDYSLGGSSVLGLGESAVANNSNENTGTRQGELRRRSLYLPIIRNDLPPFLTVFDFADSDVVTGQRNVTNVPAQALLMLNSPFVKSCAQATVTEMSKAAKQPAQKVAWLYKRLLSRSPTDTEVEQAINFIGDSATGWETFCHSLLASSEFRMLE